MKVPNFISQNLWELHVFKTEHESIRLISLRYLIKIVIKTTLRGKYEIAYY